MIRCLRGFMAAEGKRKRLRVLKRSGESEVKVGSQDKILILSVWINISRWNSELQDFGVKDHLSTAPWHKRQLSW